MLDRDAQAVVERLEAALGISGLSLRQFARALGTSPSRFCAYRTGRTAPSAVFLLRAERLADALSRARRDQVPSSIDAVEALRRAARRGDEDWTYTLALELRDRLRHVLRSHPGLSAAWEAHPPTLEARWMTLVAAFVSHEFDRAGLPAPRWTHTESLSTAWVLDSPRLTEATIKAQTPQWLADRNIFIAEKDLGTV